MAADQDPEEAARKKKTLLLLAGGAVSLILPLLGALYLRWRENREMPRQTDSAVFHQREGERRITLPRAPALPAAVSLSAPAQVPSVAPPTMNQPSSASPVSAEGSGSLGFIKPSGDYYSEKKPEPAPAPKKEEPKPASPPETPKPAAKAASTKPGKKPFVMPKLQPGKGFTSFRRNQPDAEEPAAGGGDMSELLKNLPPGAENNPELRKYLQQQGK